MKIFLFVLSLIYLPVITFSQNLVANGGFEDENICTEYNKNCAPEAWIATSLYANYYFDQSQRIGMIAPYEGTHFVGLTAGNLRTPGVRNFVRTRLLCGLQPGHRYLLQFYVYAFENILDSIGIYFSPGDFLFEKRNFKYLAPALWSADGFEESIRGTRHWQKLSFVYTATGDEGFMTIGNFKRSDYKGIRSAQYRNDYYFFIDAVSLTPADEQEQLCTQADSVRNELYNRENERHDYLSRRIYYQQKNPPQTIPLPPTRMKKPEVVQHVDTIIIPDVFFATASYELNSKSHSLLDSFARLLEKYRIDSIVMEGHTDSIGKLEYNRQLSENRALSVKKYIAMQTPSMEDKITTRGFAYLKPVAGNNTPGGRQQNRRVEIYVYRKD